MKFFNKSLVLAAVMLTLSACFAIYDTTYQFIHPTSVEGKQCVSSCATTQNACRNSCVRTETVCVSDGEDGKNITPQVSSRTVFGKNCSSYQCQEMCTEEYRQCFTGCGGQVVPQVRCVAFCDDRRK